MFGMFEAIYGYLARNLGQRNEAANSAGSLHSKAKDIKDYLTGTMYPNLNTLVGRSPFVPGKSIIFTNGNFYTTINPSTTVTNVNIAGQKTLLGGKIILAPQAANSSVQVSLKIDGVELLGMYTDTNYTMAYSFTGASAFGNFENSIYLNPQFTPLFSKLYNSENQYHRVWFIELPALPINSSLVLSLINQSSSNSYYMKMGWSFLTTPM
jgi:hypothetical protein